jgi:hypothetical protein
MQKYSVIRAVPIRAYRRSWFTSWGVIAFVACVGSAPTSSARNTASPAQIYRFADASGRQELRIVHFGRGRISFSFERSRVDGCSWRAKGSAHLVGPIEIEGEDGYPLSFDRYNNEKSEPCEVFIGIEYRAAARAQLNAGGKCGSTPTCQLDDRRSMMNLSKGE